MSNQDKQAIDEANRQLTEMDREAATLRLKVEHFLRTHYGEKCEEFDSGCECCQRWLWVRLLFDDYQVNLENDVEFRILAMMVDPSTSDSD